jgi:hypothetical protein
VYPLFELNSSSRHGFTRDDFYTKERPEKKYVNNTVLKLKIFLKIQKCKPGEQRLIIVIAPVRVQSKGRFLGRFSKC